MSDSFKPFKKPSYTMFHNFAVDVAMPTLSGAGWKILCVAIRQTWGWVDEESPTGRRQSDQISYNQFMEKTGLARSTVARAIKECLDVGYLVRRKVGEDARSGNPLYAYALNTEYEVSGTEIEPLISSSKIEPLSGTKIEPPSSSKIEPTKEKKETNKHDDGGGDEIIDAMLTVGFEPEHEARLYVSSHPQERILSWVDWLKSPYARWVRNKGAYLRRMLDEKVEPPLIPDPEPEPEESDLGQAHEPEPQPEPVDPELARAREIWQSVLDELQLQMTRETFITWLKPARVLAYEDKTLTVAVENDYAKEWLDNRLRSTIERTLTSIAGEAVELAIVVDRESDE